MSAPAPASSTSSLSSSDVLMVLICGAPATGKSSVAQWIVQQYNSGQSQEHIVSMSIDDLMMRAFEKQHEDDDDQQKEQKLQQRYEPQKEKETPEKNLNDYGQSGVFTPERWHLARQEMLERVRSLFSMSSLSCFQQQQQQQQQQADANPGCWSDVCVECRFLSRSTAVLPSSPSLSLSEESRGGPLPAPAPTPNGRIRHVLLIEDTFHLKSMRKPYLRAAQKSRIRSAIIFLHPPTALNERAAMLLLQERNAQRLQRNSTLSVPDKSIVKTLATMETPAGALFVPSQQLTTPRPLPDRTVLCAPLPSSSVPPAWEMDTSVLFLDSDEADSLRSGKDLSDAASSRINMFLAEAWVRDATSDPGAESEQRALLALESQRQTAASRAHRLDVATKQAVAQAMRELPPAADKRVLSARFAVQRRSFLVSDLATKWVTRTMEEKSVDEMRDDFMRLYLKRDATIDYAVE